jgi:hypothetical protein
MKNNQAMNLSDLAANGTALELAIAEVQGEVTVTRLKVKNAPKTSGVGVKNRRAVTGEVNYNGVAVGKGGMGNLNGVGGIGKEMVSDLDRVVSKAKNQYADDRKAAARERAAEREANAFAALDDLLSEV